MTRTLAKRSADRTVTLTLEDARRLPNLLGRIVTAHLRSVGWYAITVDGVKTFYQLEGQK